MWPLEGLSLSDLVSSAGLSIRPQRDTICWKEFCNTPTCQRENGIQAYKYEDCLLINPGSASGAYGAMTEEAAPSFVLMDINNGKVP